MNKIVCSSVLRRSTNYRCSGSGGRDASPAPLKKLLWGPSIIYIGKVFIMSWKYRRKNLIPQYKGTRLCHQYASLGPNFGLPYKYKEIPIIKALSSIESALYKYPNADEIRAKMVNITTNYLHNYKRSKHSDKLLLLMVNRTDKYLQEHQELAVINADKGNKTIILKRREYDAYIDDLVNDKKTYRTEVKSS